MSSPKAAQEFIDQWNLSDNPRIPSEIDGEYFIELMESFDAFLDNRVAEIKGSFSRAQRELRLKQQEEELPYLDRKSARLVRATAARDAVVEAIDQGKLTR